MPAKKAAKAEPAPEPEPEDDARRARLVAAGITITVLEDGNPEIRLRYPNDG